MCADWLFFYAEQRIHFNPQFNAMCYYIYVIIWWLANRFDIPWYYEVRVYDNKMCVDFYLAKCGAHQAGTACRVNRGWKIVFRFFFWPLLASLCKFRCAFFFIDKSTSFFLQLRRKLLEIDNTEYFDAMLLIPKPCNHALHKYDLWVRPLGYLSNHIQSTKTIEFGIPKKIRFSQFPDIFDHFAVTMVHIIYQIIFFCFLCLQFWRKNLCCNFFI